MMETMSHNINRYPKDQLSSYDGRTGNKPFNTAKTSICGDDLFFMSPKNTQISNVDFIIKKKRV